MAYVTFQDFGGAAAARHAALVMPRHDAVPLVADRLSALEWSVVELARHDGRGSLRPPGRLDTALRAIFRRPNPRLADPRLEVLRRVAVAAWRRGGAAPEEERKALLEAGFTPDQHDALIAHVRAVAGAGAATRRRRSPRGASRDAE